MSLLIWIVCIIGLIVAFYFWGTTGLLMFCAAYFLVIMLYRRPLVLALTRLSAKLGLNRAIINRMPSAIHLSRADESAEDARPILAALATCKFVDAGAWNIDELPGIQVSLMVQQEEGMLAAVESTSAIGAQVNINMIYPDGKWFIVTNSELPAPGALLPNVMRVQLPRCTPNALVEQARTLRPALGFRSISVDEAPRIYEELSAQAIRFLKGKGC
jgi:hypothetical protein